MSRTTRTATTIVGDICLYGTSMVGAGYLGVAMPHGQTFGDGTPSVHRSFTEAVWLGLADLKRITGAARGRVRVFHPGGERMSVIDINSCDNYGTIVSTTEPAPVYTISAEALIAASERQ